MVASCGIAYPAGDYSDSSYGRDDLQRELGRHPEAKDVFETLT
jgi:hypothetical protein